MITLITAVPGSGKTLLAVGKIWQFLEDGRQVFHNIAGLKKEAFPNHQNLHDAPDDWRQTPHGSVVIYDECQQPNLYPATAQRGAVDDARLTSMETHRHTGHDLIFITQAPTFLHHHARKLVGEHIHLYRGGGSKIVGKYTWSHTCDSPNDRREQERADFETFAFNKAHFELYQSSTVHTHKFKLPKKLIFILIFILFILFGVGYLLSDSFLVTGQLVPDKEPPILSAAAHTEAKPVRAESSLYAWSSSPPAVPVSGCIANEAKSKCMCFSADGVTLELTNAQCLSIISSPLPRQFTASKAANSI